MDLKVARVFPFVLLLLPLLCSHTKSFAQSSTDDFTAGYREFYAGNLREATRIAEQLVRNKPRSVEARILLARILMVSGQVPDAYEQLRHAQQTSPRNVDVLYYLSTVSNMMAQGHYLQLFRTAPDSARAHQLMGETYQLQNNPDKAFEEYDAAVKVDPSLLDVWLNIGDLARAQLQFERAIRSYNKAMELQPSNYDALYGLGACLVQQDPQKAVEILSRAVLLAPNEPESQLSLGEALIKTDRPADALNHLKIAVELDPSSSRTYVLMARAQKALGWDGQAQLSFKKAQDLVQNELESRHLKIRRSIQEPVLPDTVTSPTSSVEPHP